jgi:hypothetical protein
MRKNNLTKFILNHWNKLKIWWAFFAVIAMIIATRTYINYNTIIEAIEKVEDDIKMVEDEIAYSEDFLKQYLDSEYAEYFLAHKSNILFDGEYIVRFQSLTQEDKIKDNNTKNDNLIETPQQSRKHFIKSKLN